jgi:hypothetical protein
MQLDKFIDRVGDWNPQLFRELKGRFSGNTLLFTLIGSIAIQFVFGLFVADGNVPAGFQILNWLLPIALMMGGIYTLVSDISQEEKAGTLNFIRLSPQSARDIFIGKMLGVPSLVYLAVLLAVPLHLVLAIASGASLGLMLAWYSTIAITTYLCLSIATLYAISGGRFAIVLSVILVQPIGAIVSLYNYYLSSSIGKATWLTADVNSMLWFYLPIGNNIWLFYGFINLILLSISYWFWVRIDRYYINPKSTNFTKQQSYWLNLTAQVWLFGFVLSILTFRSHDTLDITVFHLLVIFSGIGSFLTFASIPLIVPSKQSMQDWSRSQRSHVTSKHKHWWKSDIVQDLLWHDRSPSVLAMAINLMIPAIIYGVCAIIFVHDLGLLGELTIGIIISTILTLICTVIANLLSLGSYNSKSGGIPLLGTILFLTMLGSVLAMMYPFTQQLGNNLLLFSPLFSIGIHGLSSLEICFDIIVQLSILAGCTKLLQGKLQKLGASESQKTIDLQPALGRSNIMR